MSEPRSDVFPQHEGFENRGLLGRGGMGVVYRAWDRVSQREVALKTLPALDPDQIFHLKQEFRVVADLSHANLVDLYELVVEDDACFFTMELLEGLDFLEWADAGTDPSVPLPPAALERIARGLFEVSAGVSAIHRAGMLHRDIKPSNIRIRLGDPDRVVLLDFGIVSPIVLDAQARRDQATASGTPAYMAPEVLRGGEPGPPSDWYSAGCVAYEALTGRRPFSNLAEALKGGPPPPSTLRKGIPAWIEDLVVSMLEAEPGRRADGARVREALKAVGADADASAAPTSRHVMPWGAPTGGDEVPFVGRRREMDVLSKAFGRLAEGVSTVVHCCGDSGIGKSELIHRFAARAENEAEAVTLRGRCHLHESVPYKAVDQVVDDLTRFLLRDTTPAHELVPDDADALCRLFPVLHRVPAFAKVGGAASEADPHILRRRGAAALAQLLSEIGARVPLVVWIDDLQWGDEDGAALIREWLRPGATPRFVLVLSYRDESEAESPLLATMRKVPVGGTAERRDLRLEPLGAHESNELTSRLLAGLSADETEVGGIVAEAAGSPFFIGQLARHLSDVRGQEGSRIGQDAGGDEGALRLADVIGRRLDGLTPLQRRVVELASVAAAPLEIELALSAAGGGPADRPVFQNLGKLCLLRVADGAAPTVQTYHAKIAEATVAGLGRDGLRGTHRALADVLQASPATEPEALVPHLLGAEDFRAAASAAAQAGDRAAEALAFERAARHYEIALEHGGPELDPHRLRVCLAEALANAGRTPEAAEWYERAADELTDGESAAEAALLRRLAAEHFTQSGMSDRGSALMRAVLADLGVSLPRSERAALPQLLWNRARLYLRGTKPATPHEVSAEKLAVLDAIWSAGTSNSMNSAIISGALVTRFVLDALDLGDPRRITMGLGMEASWCAGIGGRLLRRVEPLFAQIEALTEAHGTSYERAALPFQRAVVSWHRGLWRDSAELMQESIHLLRAECPGTAYEVSVANMYLLSSLAMSGQLQQLVKVARDELQIAQERRDLFASNACLLGESVLAWLVVDEPDLALHRADEVVAEWSRGGIFNQHYHYLIAGVQSHLYRGEAWPGWRRIVEGWPRIRSARTLDMENARVQMLYLRARAALAAAADPKAPPPRQRRWSRRRLRRRAAGDARRIARSSLPFAKAIASTIQGAIAAQEGNPGGAEAELLTALAGFDASGMPVHREAVRARLGGLRDDADGKGRAYTWLEARGVARPERLTEVYAPPVGRLR